MLSFDVMFSVMLYQLEYNVEQTVELLAVLETLAIM